MIDSAVADRATAGSPARIAGVLLGVLALVICACRMRYFQEPLENDLTIRMAYAARSVAGARYYSDLVVYGPAGSLWVNEVFYRLFGATELSIYVMGCVFSVLTLLGVYRCAHLLTDIRGGLIAAVAWTLVNADLFTQANQPNSEVIINAALVWAFALVFDPRAMRSRRYLIVAGLLFFLASSVKHFVAVTPALAAAFAVLLPTRGVDGMKRKVDKDALRAWAVVAVTALAAWALLFGWYAVTDRLPAVLRAMFGSSVVYATQQQGFFGSLVSGIQPSGLMPPYQLPFIVLYVCLVAAIVHGLRGTPDPRWRLVVGWTLGTWLSVSLSGRFYPHYYMLWLPLISIGAGAAFGLAQAIPRPRLATAVRVGIAVALLAIGVRQVSQIIQYDAASAVLAKYGYPGAVFTEIRALGKRLAQSAAASSVFEIGAHGLYFYAAHPAPSPFVDSLYGIANAFPIEYREKMLPGLLESPPDVLVIRRSVMESNSDVALRGMVAELLDLVSYAEDKEMSGRFLLVVRRLQPDARKSGG